MPVRPLEHGVVGADIADIIDKSDYDPKAITYNIILHTVDEDIPIDDLITIETKRDYANNVADHIIVTFAILAGTYVRSVHKFMDNLEMTIVTNWYDKKYSDRYKLMLVKGPSNIAGTLYSSYTEDELNRLDKFVIEAQCLDRLVEVMRLTQVSGTYSKHTVQDVISGVMSKAINNITIEDTPIPTAFSFIDPNNQQIYRHINIPIGTTAISLPVFLQEGDYGVYNTDIGVYIQKYGYFEDGKEPITTVFVYPLYNNELADHPGRKLMILSSPTNQYSAVDRSYLLDGDVIKIIGTGDMRSGEVGQTKLMNTGNTIVTGSTANIVGGVAAVTDDAAKIVAKQNLHGAKLKVKVDGTELPRYVKPTSNPYKYYSEIAKNLLSPYQITWNYSNPELLHPGMAVTYVYEDIEVGAVRLNGVLHSCYNSYNQRTGAHVTLLNVLLEPYTDGVANAANTTVDVRTP